VSQAFLEPELLASLHSLDLIARQVVKGFLSGLHRSPFHGFSPEFDEYRQYNPGESITHIDWRVNARSKRYYVKVFSEETNLRTTMLLDCSASMTYGAGSPRWTKLEYARNLAAAFAYLLLHQNDAVGLITFDERPLSRVPLRATRHQFFRLLAELEQAPLGSGTLLRPVLDEVAEMIPRHGLVLLFSDLMDDIDEVMTGLKHLRYRGHEVIVFQILDPREIDLAFRHEMEFEALEDSTHRVRIDPAHARGAYQERFERWRQDLRQKCHDQLIELVDITTETPLEVSLHGYLERRKRMY